jgi:serine/threonine protein kinase/tetratricopeptide (TPR) repeat protein
LTSGKAISILYDKENKSLQGVSTLEGVLLVIPIEPDNDKTQNHTYFSAGVLIGRYRLIRPLGTGGMGTVYLAEDTQLGRKIALKFLSVQYATSPEGKARFIREAQAAAALNHSNIVTIHEVAEHQSRPYIAMEFIDGETLRDLIGGSKLELTRAIDIAVQICEGLNAAHQANIIHRDIKPGNVLIDKTGRAKIVDFGLAKKTQEASEQTRPGVIVGTDRYMSPEQAQGKAVDHRSDIFSLGILLYEMISGQSPFSGSDVLAVMHSIVYTPPEPLSTRQTKVPHELERIVLKALEKDPAKRYQNVVDLEADLKNVRNGLKPSFWKRPLVWVAGLIVLANVVLWSTPAFRQWIKELSFPVPAKKHLVVLPFTNIGDVLSNQPLCDGLTETVTSKLTQLEQFQGALWVVPTSEVRQRNIVSAHEARRAFGVNLAVSASVQHFRETARVTLNLVDAKTERQLRSTMIDAPLTDVSALQDSVVIKVAELLELELQSRQRRVLTAGGTTVAKAHHSYLRGLGYLSQRFEQRENLDSAIILFQQALEEDPLYALAYAGLGEAYWHKYEVSKDPQWVEQAIHNSRRAVEINDQLAPVHVTMGLIRYGTGRYEEALLEFRQALKIDSVSHEAYRGLAKTYAALNKPAEAEATYKRAIELKPNYWAGYYDLEYFYVSAGRYDEALLQLHKVVELLPDYVPAYDNLGGLYFQLGRFSEARSTWERALQIESTGATYSNIGSSFYIEGHYNEAAQMYEKALELDSTNYQIWLNLASVYYWIPGEREKAIAAYQRAIRLAEEQKRINPLDPVVLSDLSECYAMTGNETDARSYISQALSIASTDPGVMVRAGLVYEALGEREQALEWIGKALEKGYPLTLIESSPSLNELRADPGFQRLIPKSGKEVIPDTGAGR